MIQPVIKWSGSKRSQASRIVALFPDFGTYYDPFIGGGALLHPLKGHLKSAIAGDICSPLIQLWDLIKEKPEKLTGSYRHDWERLQNEGYNIYYQIRDRFNENPNGEDLFFLSRTCVNGLIRFNKQGKFNNSLHHTRKGIAPDRIECIIKDWSGIIQDVTFINADYRQTTKDATSDDFIYLDPPYFNTKGRYYGKINYEDFIGYLEDLNRRKIKYALSYDGFRGNNIYLNDLPKSLFKRHILQDSGNSSFKKVMDKKCESVKESVYLNF